MAVEKMSISLKRHLADEVREAADRAGKGVSAWVAEAAAAKLRSEALSDFLDDWEGRHGALTGEELATALEELGLPRTLPT